VQRVGLPRRGEPFSVGDGGHVALAAGVRQLEDVAAVVLVDAPAELAPEGDALVGLDAGEPGDDLPPLVHRGPRREDRPDAAACELQLPVDPRLGAAAVVVVQTAGDVRAKDAVLDLEVAEAKRLEDRLGAHGPPGP
jgi:hypothetical protein